MILILREANMKIWDFNNLQSNINRKTRGTACYFNTFSFTDSDKRYFKISKDFINILDAELNELESQYIKDFKGQE